MLLDTNVLLLWLTGCASLSLVERLSNTGKGTTNREDFLTIQFALSHLPVAHKFVVTPHIAAETWNLLESAFKGQMLEQVGHRFMQYAGVAVERSRALEKVTSNSHFLRLGVADVAQLFVRGKRTTVLTDDARLAAALESENCGVVNLNWLRFDV